MLVLCFCTRYCAAGSVYHARVLAYSHGNAYSLSLADSDAFAPADGLSNAHVTSYLHPSASCNSYLDAAFPAGGQHTAQHADYSY